ncbi:hypothetical protein HDU67_002830 [Dinochytrium kinnereticum]|nr:hypothetical protein HDU67_002830 [Dinochytrium kinnereticum]
MLRSSHFTQDDSERLLDASVDTDVFHFRVLGTPIVDMFRSSLNSTRPDTVVATQLGELFRLLTTYVIWIFLAICLIVNAIRLVFVDASGRQRADVLLESLFNYQFYAILPILPLSLPGLCLIARSYGNAQIVCLFDVLQSSKQEFKDEEDIDEFDAAPPPTKDVNTDWVEEPIVLDLKEDASSNIGVIFEDKDWTRFMTIARLIGFNESVVSKYTPMHVWHTLQSGFHYDADDVPDYHYERLSISSEYLGNCHVFSDGDVNVILKYCGDYWNGSDISFLNANTEKKIMEFYQSAILSDMNVISFSFRPLGHIAVHGESLAEMSFDDILVKDSLLSLPSSSKGGASDLPVGSSFTRLNDVQRSRLLSDIDKNGAHSTKTVSSCLELLKGQTFLGMASLFYQPKPNVTDFIEDLDLAGIRFVYFSSAPERESKGTQGYLELHDMKAKLPRGVENIRSHLRDVDDVPLHVSLFAECTPDSIQEMADIAIAIDPFIALKARSNVKGPVASLVLSSRVITSACALKLHFDTSLYSLSQIIREARTLVNNAKQNCSLAIK